MKYQSFNRILRSVFRNTYLYRALKMQLQHIQAAKKICQFQAFMQTRNIRMNSAGTLDSTLIVRPCQHPRKHIFSLSIIHNRTPEGIITAQRWHMAQLSVITLVLKMR